jgi:hypothetical protein
MLQVVTGTGSDADVYAAVLRQAAHDAVRAVLAAPPDSITASAALRNVTAWLARTYGPVAVQDLAEELAVDLAEAFDALASAEGRDPLTLLDAWFHDQPAPGPLPAPAPAQRERPLAP